MRRLDYELKSLCRRFGGGSFGTQSRRRATLLRMASELHALGYPDMNASSLKLEHVEVLVERSLHRGLGLGTIKNRAALLRWWAKSIGKPHLIPPSNAELGIPRRPLTPIHSRGKRLDPKWMKRIPDERMRISLRLQQEFGLRCEESLKFRPSYADQRDHIRLKGSWTKGGKPRVVPILNSSQAAAVAAAHAAAGDGSMIPPEKQYKTHLGRFKQACLKAGILHMHGLRHGYAQRRYCELAGFEVPLLGGPKRSELSEHQRLLDWLARITVSRELGHERVNVTNAYLGI